MRRGLGFHNRRSPGVAIFSPASLFAGGVQGAWYDPSDFGPSGTLFQDSAGTTPVTAVEQPVGLMLDKRSTPYSVFFDGTGDYLSIADSASLNAFGDFTIEFWINFSAVTNNSVILGKGYPFGLIAPYLFFVNGTTLNFYASSNGSSFNVASAANVIVSVSTSQWYHVVVCRSGSTLSTFSNGTRTTTITNNSVLYTNAGALTLMSEILGAASANGYISNLRVVKGVAVYDPTQATLTVPTAPLSPITGTSLLTCGTTWSGNPAITRNGDARADRFNPFVSGTAAGNLAYQSTSASRPTLQARYNLLTYSEQFDNAAWTKQTASITANSTTAPDGTTTAETFGATAAGGGYVYSAFAAAAATYTMSVYAKANTANQIRLDFVTAGFGNGGTCVFTLTGSGSAGAVTQFGGSTGYAASITSVGNGWYRCSLTGAATATTWYYELANLANGQSVFIWGAQLVPTAVFPSNTYQRIGAATDYATGAAFPPYLFLDGVDDSFLINSVDFTGTDKMLVVAGVTKNSDAAQGVVTELSATIASNNGAFLLSAPNSAAANYNFSSKGTTQVDNTVTTYAAPRVNVLTGVADVAAPSNVIRVNGVQAGSVATTQGTGNYGNYPLYIGSRGGTTLRFNGNIYSLVIAGAAYSAGQISSTESWVAAKTPLGTI